MLIQIDGKPAPDAIGNIPCVAVCVIPGKLINILTKPSKAESESQTTYRTFVSLDGKSDVFQTIENGKVIYECSKPIDLK